MCLMENSCNSKCDLCDGEIFVSLKRDFCQNLLCRVHCSCCTWTAPWLAFEDVFQPLSDVSEEGVN